MRSAHVFEHVAAGSGRGLRLAAFTSATGSAGTIAAGDRLKDEYGTKIVAVEALECPTMLENGFGEHNIQGIGDKHIPLIHNVMNTDVVVAVSDRATDELDVLFNSDDGRGYLGDRKGVPAADPRRARALRASRRSATCSPPSARPRLLDLGPDDAIITVATDGAALYPSERAKTTRPRLRRRVHRPSTPREVFGEHLANVDTAAHARAHRARPQPHLQPRLLHLGRAAGHAVRAVRGPPRSRTFWRDLRRYLPVWDEMIDEFNARVAGRR